MSSWPRETVLLLIELYESYPCLYTVSSVDYYNKAKRNEALADIAAQVSVLRPNTTKDDIKYKINGLRTQFMAENAKTRRAKMNGTPDVHPTLWFYQKLKFLNSHIMPRKYSSRSRGTGGKEEDYDMEEGEMVEKWLEQSGATPHVDTYVLQSPSPKCSPVSDHGISLKRKLQVGDELPNTNTSSCASLHCEQQCSVDDTFGRYIVSELKQIKSLKRKRTLMQEIQTLIWDAHDEEADATNTVSNYSYSE